MRTLHIDRGFDTVFRAFGAQLEEGVLVLADRGGVEDLVEAHQIGDNLLVDVGLHVAFDQVEQDVDCAPSLVAKHLARCDVVCRDDVGWFVLLHLSQLGARLLKLAVKHVYEGCIEAH